LAALNRGLTQVGFEPLRSENVVAPSYSDLLGNDATLDVDLPPLTYKVKDDRHPRRKLEQRQARVQRILGNDPGVRTHGFDYVPGPTRRTALGAVSTSSGHNASTMPPDALAIRRRMRLPQTVVGT
jgi:hypothetical protein